MGFPFESHVLSPLTRCLYIYTLLLEDLVPDLPTATARLGIAAGTEQALRKELSHSQSL